MSDTFGFGAFLAGLTLVVGSFAAWVTHVVWIIGHLASDAGATGGQITLGIMGALLPPVGVIHGVILWLS